MNCYCLRLEIERIALEDCRRFFFSFSFGEYLEKIDGSVMTRDLLCGNFVQLYTTSSMSNANCNYNLVKMITDNGIMYDGGL